MSIGIRIGISFTPGLRLTYSTSLSLSTFVPSPVLVQTVQEESITLRFLHQSGQVKATQSLNTLDRCTSISHFTLVRITVTLVIREKKQSASDAQTFCYIYVLKNCTLHLCRFSLTKPCFFLRRF